MKHMCTNTRGAADAVMTRRCQNIRTVQIILSASLATTTMSACAQPVLLDAVRIARTSGAKTTTSKDGVVRIGWSRDDVKLKVDGMPFPPAAGLGSWAAFKATTHGAMVMGDTVVFRDEVDAAIDAAFDHGLKVTALHNHFFYDEPKVFFMHIGGHGDAEKLAAGVKAVWDAIKRVRAASPQPADGFGGPTPTPGGTINAERIGRITGLVAAIKPGGVVKVSKGREGEMNETPIDGSMGLGSWAAFVGSDDLASIDGDFIMTGPEVQPVLHALRKSSIHIVALHNHMIGEAPAFFFVHFWGVGPATTLAEGFRAALNAQSKTSGLHGPNERSGKDRESWNFDTDTRGKIPLGWSIRQTNSSRAMATWQVMADRTAPSGPNVLALTETQNYGGTFNLAMADGTAYKNIDLSVRVKPVGGSEDQGGGPMWRARDENNYYVARFNPLESNFRVYYVKNGRRKQLQSARINTEPGTWYTVRVTMIGDHIACYLDGKKLLEATDDTFKNAGIVGLWTKADAVTRFDGLQVRAADKQEASPLTLRQTIALPGVAGRIDHLTLDAADNRLFLAALENGTMEVIDLTAGRRIRSVGGLSEPQGIIYIPESKRVIVACGGDGTVRSFDADAFKEIARCDLGDDADNIRWDPSRNLLHVGFGDGSLGVLEAETLTVLRKTKLAAHPESLQLDRSNGRIYVNVPDAHQITIIDRKNNAVVTSWAVTAAAANYPMALDEVGGRLFAACRKPPRLLVFDTASGSRLATTECVGDADDIFYDVQRKRIYVIGGEGFVDVLSGAATAAYPRLGRARTSPGARTGLYVPRRGLLYVALPAQEEQEAQVRIYQVSR